MPARRNPTRPGLAFGATAYLLWGVYPLYWPLLKPASAIEIVAHRVLWSLGFLALLLWRTHRWPHVIAVVRDRRLRRLLTIAALVISVNWGVYIWGVNHDRVVETSLGYFITPPLTILLGVVVLHEQLRRPQWLAVVVASVAIVTLAVDYGHVPWIALMLAGSFGTYSYVKKRANVEAIESLAVETAVLTVPALATLAVLAAQGTLAIGGHGAGNTALLVGSGVVTAVPLLCFAAAAIRLSLSTMGLLQYLAPVLQFLVGVFIVGESMPVARLIGFALVWTALIILTADGLRHSRRRAAVLLATAQR